MTIHTRFSRRAFLKGLGAAAISLPAWTQPMAHDRRLNVLFLFADDQRFSTIHALNNPAIQTPHLDALARDGLTFTRAHIMGGTSAAVCMPSRAMLMSGRNLFHLQGKGENIPPEHVTWPETFRNNGYTTFGTGKWHNGKPSYARSFSEGGDIFFGGMWNHLEVPVFDFDPSGQYPKEQQHTGAKFSSELFSDTAIEFLERQTGEQPFFAYVSYMAPHDPRMAPKAYADLYPPGQIELPPNFLPEHPFDNGELKIRDEMLAPFPRTPEAIRENIAAYYAMITHLDAQIGRVLQTLEDKGLAENTLVIFSADNGLAVGQHGLMGKQNLYEHSSRVPLLLRGPGIPKGGTCDALCYLHDLFPTVCDLCGASIPDTVETRSLVPLIRGEKQVLRESVFGAYLDLQRMVCTERWKLILYNVNGVQTTQLFDERDDPWETRNLADEPSQAGRIAALRALLADWMTKLDDPCDINQPNWGLQ